ncbi:MAG TPA: hypothetical protein VK308_13275, partial [Pyrinomonadaceae bacterium]|nr:hypothetical protein [Pyrinomonadaceae bacterium]
MNRKLNLIVLLLAFYCLLVFSVQAQTTGFTYQGRLTDGSVPASGTYDLQFALFDAPSDGIQQPQPAPITVTSSAVQVTNGVFSVQLNFGASAFPGADRYLEIRVKKPAEAGYTTLNPRQRITSVPYAVRSLTAGQAESATTATTAASFSGSLTGEVSGTQNNTVVNSVGGVTAADVATGAQAANAATSLNTPNTIVKRNDSGGFSAGAVNITDYRLNVGPYGVLRVDGEPVNFGGAKPLAQFRSSFGSSSFNRDVFRISTDGGFAALGELGFG